MVSQDFGVHALGREGTCNWGKLWLAEFGGVDRRRGSQVSRGGQQRACGSNAGSRRETPGNLLPSENKGRRRARTWLVPGPHRCPPGPGDNLLHPLARSSVLTGARAPHPPLAVTTQDCALWHHLFSLFRTWSVFSASPFLKVSSGPGFVKACGPQNESGDDVKERFHWFAFLSFLPFLFN